VKAQSEISAGVDTNSHDDMMTHSMTVCQMRIQTTMVKV